MQSVMIMKVHFLIPRKLHYFDLEAKSEMKQKEEAEMEALLLEKEDKTADDFKRADWT